jgi:hypothetical protein
MSDQLSMFDRTIWQDSTGAIFSLELADGITLLICLDTKAKYGQEAAHVNHFRILGRKKENPMQGTSGQNSIGLSRSAGLQLSLESRLRVRLGVNGSDLFNLTWKRWDIPSRPPICALRASVRRISGSVSGSWPTPNAIPETRGGLQSNPEKALERRERGHQLNLDDAATLSVWATPATRDYRFANAKSYQERSQSTKGEQLNNQVVHCSGPMPGGPIAETGKVAQLSPAFSLWLMGYHAGWVNCAPQVMPSSRKLRPSS